MQRALPEVRYEVGGEDEPNEEDEEHERCQEAVHWPDRWWRQVQRSREQSQREKGMVKETRLRNKMLLKTAKKKSF